jgi:SEC10/PgrA surface exclusion-like protein
MNRKIARWTMVAALTTTMGLVAIDSNVKADTQVDPTATTTPTQQAISSATISATDLHAATAKAAASQYNQQVNIPNGYTLNAVGSIHDNTAAVNFQNNTAGQGMRMNNYTSDPQAASESVDVSNLNADQTSQMNNFALNLVNQVRSKFGESGFTQTAGSIDVAKNMAGQYQNKQISLLNNGWHDQSILQGASENISAYGLYHDNIANLGYEHFAAVRGSELTDSSHLPLIVVTNMDDLQAMIYYGVMGMLFQDANDNFGHAQNFLTNTHGTVMGVYPSITSATNSGTTTDSNGNVVGHFNFNVQRVDMHFIWPKAEQLNNGSQQTTTTHQPGWSQVNGVWYHYDNNGKLQTGWQKINGAWYYLNSSNGQMATGLQKINGATYLLNNSGAMQTGWQKVNGHWYLFNGSGAAVTGWYKSGAGNWYYFGSDGASASGWQWINGHWYYFDNNNAWADAGWLKLGNSWYYLDPTNDWMLTGWQWINGAWYYLQSNGQMATGLQKINGATYLLNGSGAMQTGWKKVNGHWYLFNGSGAAVTGWYKSGAGNWYYFGSDGASLSGWQTINGHRYYFDSTNAWALTGWQKIGDSWYYFDPTNAWADTGWQYLGHWFYFDDQGKMQTGHVKVDGRYSNFDNNGYWLGYAD